MSRLLRCIALALGVGLSVAPSAARADDTIKTPGDHPEYKVEIEPHVLLGWDSLFPGDSYGLGERFSIPLVDRGFVPSINDTVAITFGADLLHFGGCYVVGYS